MEGRFNGLGLEGWREDFMDWDGREDFMYWDGREDFIGWDGKEDFMDWDEREDFIGWEGGMKGGLQEQGWE